MYKEALRGIAGLEVTTAIAVVIFFTFFVGLFWYVYGYTKKHSEKMENLPLEENEVKNQNKTKENENNK